MNDIKEKLRAMAEHQEMITQRLDRVVSRIDTVLWKCIGIATASSIVSSMLACSVAHLMK